MANSPVSVRLLGGFEIQVNGAIALSQASRRKKPLALIKLLALQPGRQMHRDVLLAALWPELPQAAAAAQLRKNRLYLRQSMEACGWSEELLELAGDTIRLADSLTADTDIFSRAARTALDRVVDTALLKRAIESYGGDLLPDDVGAEWTEPTRRQLRALYHEMLLALSRQLEASANYMQAIDVATVVVEADELHEEGQRALIRLHALNGRRDLALRQYDVLSTRLAELGATPDEETELLVRQIRNQTLRGIGYVSSAAPFVGRTDELRQLRGAFEQVRAGAGQVVLLRGEAGIGKTRLAESFAAHAHQAGARVLWARSYEDESERGFGRWIQLIRTLSGVPAGASDERGTVHGSRIHALLASSSTAQDAMFTQVAAFLREHARRQPLVLIFDDLQWCGGDSLRLLQTVSREIRDSQVMVIGTVREESTDIAPAVAPLIDALAVDRRSLVLTLGGLSVEDIDGLVALTPSKRSSASARELWEQTRGNALFVTELLRATRSEPAGGGKLALPPQVSGVIRRRIDRLSEDSRRLLDVAAVFGGEFALATLAHTTELPSVQLLDLLEEARRAQLVGSAGDSTERLTFAHPLMREVIYDAIPAAQRAETHLRVARALEAQYGSEAAAHASELAHHYRLAVSAGAEDQALSYLHEAGLQALTELAFEDAARHFEAELEIAETRRPEDRLRHGEIRLQLGSVLYRTYDGSQRDQSNAVLLRALDDARATGSAPLFVKVAGTITGKRRSSLGVIAENVRLLREALAMVGQDDLEARCQLSGQLAKEMEGELDDRARVAAGREAIELARELGVSGAQAMVYGLDAIAGPDSLEERLAHTQELTRMTLPRGESVTAQAQLRRYAALLEAGDLDRAERALSALSDVSRQHPVSTVRRWAERWFTVMAADQLTNAGRFDEAEQGAQRGLALSQAMDDPDGMSIFGSQLFQLRWHQGRLPELAGVATNILNSAPDFWPWRVGTALIQLSCGEEKAARIAFERIVRQLRAIPRDRFWLVTMTVAAELCARMEVRQHTFELLEMMEPFSDRVAVLGFGQVSAGSYARSVGLLHGVAGSYDSAQRCFETALRANAGLGSVAWVAWTELHYGEMLLQLGTPDDLGRARALLSSALETGRERGMAEVHTRAERLLADAHEQLAQRIAARRHVPSDDALRS